VFGSERYVAPPTPLEGIYAAAMRRTLDGRNPGGWVPALVDRNLFEIPAEQIRDARVLLTVAGGRVVFD
jgi:predicted amidohydrolase YtcJ